MANAKSTAKRPPPPYPTEELCQATVREQILPSSVDLSDLGDTLVVEDTELFSLDYLRSCLGLPLLPEPNAPPRRAYRTQSCPIRQLKVGSLPRISSGCYHENLPVPFVRLAGRWLAQAGFQIGTSVCVKVDSGRLVIEAVPGHCATDSTVE